MVTSERCDAMKPHREIFEYALRCTGAKAEASLMIGDALDVDIVGAMAAGIDAAYFNPQRTLHSVKPKFEVASLQELIAVL
jgi:putative hydrolase of the HAD superfamily